MKDRLRVLVLEDRASDAQLMLHELRRAGYQDVQWKLAEGREAFLRELANAWDVILADYNLPDFNAYEALQVLRERQIEVPLIVVSGEIGEETAVAMIRAGAADYLLKDRLLRLGSAVEQALHQQRLSQSIQVAEQERDRIFIESPNLQCIASFDGWFRRLNPSWSKLLGHGVEELMASPFLEFVHPADREATLHEVERLAAGQETTSFEIRCLHRDGSYRWILWNATPFLDQRSFYATGHDITVRKQVEEQLQLSQVQLGEAQAIARIGYWEWDVVSDEVTWSAQMYDIFGVTAAEFDGQLATTLQRIHPEDRQRIEQLIAEALSLNGTSGPHEFGPVECRLARPDGTERVILARGRLVYGDDGALRRVVGTDQDVTEEKMAGRRLAAQSAATRVVAEADSFQLAAPQCLRALVEELAWQGGEIWLPDAQREKLQHFASYYPSSTVAGAMEASVRSVTFQRGFGLPGRVWQAAESVWIADLSQDTVWARQAEARRAGLRSALAFPVLRNGEVMGVVALFSCHRQRLDENLVVTLQTIGSQLGQFMERKEAEATLRLRDRAMEAIGEGIVITDASLPDNPIIYVNPAFERITGYSREQVLGKNSRLLQGPGSDPQALEQLQLAVRHGRPISIEVQNYRADGSPFWNQLSITPIRDRTGKLTHFVGVQHDITERRKLEAEYTQVQKMESIGRLAGGVAHDFNNLLTVILGYSEAILNELGPDHPLRELVEAIDDAGQRAATLTSQLLAFSRKQVLEPVVIDINTLILDLGKMLPRLIGEDIQVLTRLAPDLASTRVDPGQVGQIVMNLATNARDAMPAGGKLTLETYNVYFDEAYARLHPDVKPGHYVLLAVSDTGCGMSAEVKSRLFEPFFTTKGRGQGTGMGLPTVFGIIKQSGGHIVVQSEPGQGATFKIYLPQAEHQAEQYQPRPLAGDLPRGSETILLVEDEESVRSVARHFLLVHGYTVLEAADGDRALEVSERYRGPIHLLLTDVVMPEMSGRQLAQRLAALRPELRTLYISGYTDDAIVHHGVLEEGVAFLQKPFSQMSLLHRVRAVLDGC